MKYNHKIIDYNEEKYTTPTYDHWNNILENRRLDRLEYLKVTGRLVKTE